MTPGFNRQKKAAEPESAEKAYDYAVFLLSLRLRTAGEIVDKMKQKGFNNSAIERTIQELKRHRYLDDRRYAEIFLENLKKYKNFGYFGIKKKLAMKKLPQSLIEEVLEGGFSAEDELSIAKRFLKKEDRSTAISQNLKGDQDFPAAGKEKQKIAQKLSSRGFRAEAIAKLLY